MRISSLAAGIAAACMLAGCVSQKVDSRKFHPFRMEMPVGEIYGFLTLPSAVGEFPTVIMSHGFEGSANDFPIYVKYLTENGIATYNYDFRGASRNTRSTGLTTRGMTVLTEEEDLEAVIEAVRGMKGVKKDAICLFGGSMGGLVSALVADKPEWESKVAALILLYPAFFLEKDWTDNFASDDDIPENVDGWPFPDVKLGREFALTARHLDTFNHIGHYTGPVLIMQGTSDKLAYMSDSDLAARLYPNAMLQRFVGEHHGFSNAGDMEASKLVIRFIKSAGLM